VAKDGSKLGKEIEGLKKRLQASKKHLKQTGLKAENLNALIEATRRRPEGQPQAQKINKKTRDD
jgi:hypothetical protein